MEKLSKDDENYIGGFFEFIEEWSQLTPGWNWRTFHIIQWEIEDDRDMGGIETTMIILGLGFRWRYNYGETATVRRIKRDVAELKRELEKNDD